MTQYYFDKFKVAKSYGLLILTALGGFVVFCFRFDGFKKFYVYGPVVFYIIYIIACILKRVYYKKPVVTIMDNKLIMEKFIGIFIHRTVEIPFDEIQYITTDIKNTFKIFYLKTKDDSEYKFNFNMLNSTHEEIVEELKKYNKNLLDGGIFEFDDDSSLNME